jgi:hypothetical protein
VESAERNNSCLVVDTGKALCLNLELAVCEFCKTSMTYFFYATCIVCVFLFLFKVKETSRETLDGGVCETTKSNPTL